MPKLEPPRFPWTAPEVLICAAVAAGTYVLILYLPILGPMDCAWRTLARTLVLAVAFTAPPVAILRMHGRRALDLWMPPGDLGRDLAAGLVLGLLLASMNGMLILSGDRGFDVRPPGRLDGIVWGSSGLRDVGFLFVGVGLLVPIAEEVLFRGLLYPALRKSLPAAPSILISAGIFGAAHLDEMQMRAFLVGVIAAIFVEYTGSLVPAVFGHMGINLSFILFLANGAVLAKAVPAWAMCAAFVIFNVLLFLLGRALFSPEEASAPAPCQDPDGPPAEEPGTFKGDD